MRQAAALDEPLHRCLAGVVRQVRVEARIRDRRPDQPRDAGPGSGVVPGRRARSRRESGGQRRRADRDAEPGGSSATRPRSPHGAGRPRRDGPSTTRRQKRRPWTRSRQTPGAHEGSVVAQVLTYRRPRTVDEENARRVRRQDRGRQDRMRHHGEVLPPDRPAPDLRGAAGELEAQRQGDRDRQADHTLRDRQRRRRSDDRCAADKQLLNGRPPRTRHNGGRRRRANAMISWDEQRIELAVPWPTLAVAASAPPTPPVAAQRH